MVGFPCKQTSFLCALCLALASCASGPARPDAMEYQASTSYAFAQSEPSALRDALAGHVRENAGESGFRLLPNGEDSLRMRLALIQAAEKSLDLQYYAMRNDGAADLVLEALLKAAERGVRVRFLLDNISRAEVEDSLSVLNGQKNISVRIFNPIATRDQGFFARINGLFVNLAKATKRMHNKLLVADNQLAITGGRNIGDEYFDARPDVNFKDMDLLAAGPIVARMSNSFDRYWNSKESFPIEALYKPAEPTKKARELRARMKSAWDDAHQTAEGRKLLGRDLAQRLKTEGIGLIWARAELTVDDPIKVDVDASEAHSKTLSKLEALLDDAEKEFIAVSPYFVPREDGVAWLSGLAKRGINVRILTNSLASTDVVAVHTGYERYREDVVKAGIELYEFKPVDGKRPRQRFLGSSAPPQASLHSKVYVIDRKDVVVGSYNLDPRSNELNTEIAVVIHSPEIAAQIVRIFEDSIKPEQSYHVRMTDAGLRWLTSEDGQRAVLHKDPGAGLLRRAQIFLFSFLPIEDQL